MDSRNGIVFSLGVTDLNVVKLIKTSENIQYDDSICTDLVDVFFKNRGKMIFAISELTVSDFSISSFGGVNLFGVGLFYK